MADIIDICRQEKSGASSPVYPTLGYCELRDDLSVLPIEEIEAEYYLRIPAVDKVGVMAKISTVLEAEGISIEAVIQKEPSSESVPIVILTHSIIEKKLNQAIAALEALPEVTGSIARIRVEPFHGESA